MKPRIAKWALAAIILIALGAHFWGRSIDGASVTLADVLTQMREFRPYRCRYTVEEVNKPPDVRTVERLSRTQRRELFSDGSILVYDFSIPKELALYPDKKQAHEHWPDFEPKKDLDFLALAQFLQDGVAETLGTSTLDGRTVAGFNVALGGNDMTVWADVRTKLPARLEIIHLAENRRLVFDRFEFDVPFDRTLFGTTAPAGYAVKKTGKGYTDIPHVGEGLPEEPLLTGLKVVAEALEGVFPQAIELPQLQETLRQYIKDHKFSDEQKETWLLPVSDYWTRAVWYLNQLRGVDGVQNLRWRGGGVHLGDGQTAIMWWQYQNASTYRVIYGDLAVRDLRPDELPK